MPKIWAVRLSASKLWIIAGVVTGLVHHLYAMVDVFHLTLRQALCTCSKRLVVCTSAADCRGVQQQGVSRTTPGAACCTLRALWRCKGCLSTSSTRGAGCAGRSVTSPCLWPLLPFLVPASSSYTPRLASASAVARPAGNAFLMICDA